MVAPRIVPTSVLVGRPGTPGLNADGTTAEAAMVAVDADAGSSFRVQQDARLTASYAAKSQVANLAGGLHLPTRMSGRKWRTKRAQVLAGLARGHIAILGDSISFGAAATGTTPPKNQTSYPGRLRAMLEQAGRWGGGWVICNADVFTNPTWDTRWTFGAGVTAPTGTGASGSFGFHRAGTYLIPAGGYVEFTDTMDKVQILTAQGSSGLYTVKVDGVSVGTVGNGSGVGTIAKASDTAGTYAPSQEVTVEISAGTLGSHTVRIEAPAAASTYLMAIKPIVSGNGKFEVTNASISGKSIYSLWSASAAHNDETNGLYGLPMVDFLKADLLVCALGINDLQFPRTLAATQTDVATLMARQTTSGNAPTGAAKANGSAMLLWNPQPDLTLAAIAASPDPWSAWHAGWYDSADAAGVPLLDLGERWIDYATGNTAGLFADGIHPNDTGSLDLVSIVHEAVMHGV